MANEANTTAVISEKEKQQNIRSEKAMQVPVVTQDNPNDAANGNRIVPKDDTEATTKDQLEQDVMITNPSVESMESRG